MPHRPFPRPPSLTPPQRLALLRWWLQAPTPRQAKRALAIVAASDLRSIAATARHVGMQPHTVSRWLARYRRRGVAGLQDRPRTRKDTKKDAHHQALYL